MTRRAGKQWAQTRILVKELKRQRIEQGLSQRQVGRLMGVNQSTISQLEAMTNDPQAATLQRYAQALGLSLRFSLEETMIGRHQREQREKE